jgi:Flp pilus assembly protein TadG
MSRIRDNKGVVAVELVIVFPILLTLITAIISVGGYLGRKTDVTGQAYNAARSLALTGSVGTLSGTTVTSSTPCPASGPGTAVVTLVPTSGSTYAIKVFGISTVTKSMSATGRYPCNS